LTRKEKELSGVGHLARKYTPLSSLLSLSRYVVKLVYDYSKVIPVLNMDLLIYPGWRQLGEFTYSEVLCYGSNIQLA
jgi:hypothetical protein